MSSTEDNFFIDRVCKGDIDAYTFLVNKYKRMAYTVALKIMRNVEDAEDATQESFIKAYQKIHYFKKDAKFSTWLYTIVYRTAVYNLRKNQISTTQIDEIITEEYSTEDNNVFTVAIENQLLLEKVTTAIHKLPRMESLLISLFYTNESSIEEISIITGLSKTNIKVKLYRARKKLKKLLDNPLTETLKKSI
ncbi:MAG: RNA polymerase sigma factor [Cellulophaga sp.]